ncbi:MAG: ABC transporter permease subunit [bacterium]|nr:ABC transporter permease subunit [bacterium]
MQARLVRTIFQKELRDILRDRRTLFIMIVLPILLYPLLFVGMLQITVFQLSRMQKQDVRLVVLGREYSPPLSALLDTLAGVTAQDTAHWIARLQEGEVEVALEIPPGLDAAIERGEPLSVGLFFNGSRDRSQMARDRLDRALTQWKDDIVATRLSGLRADTSLLHPFVIQAENLATQEQRQGDFLGRILGYMLVFMTMMGAFYPAVDLTAGEKERGTLETLLVSPVSRGDIVYGKFFAVLLISLLTAVLNLASMGLTAAFGLRQLGASAAAALPGFSVSPLSLTLSLILILPLAVLFSALCLAIASGARNYKEGQSLLTPVYMLVILPAMVSLIPGMEVNLLLATVPIVNVSLLVKEFMMGNYLWNEMLVAMASTSLLAAAALAWAISQFRQESVLFRHAEEVRWSPFRFRRARSQTALAPPGTALLVWVVIVLLLFYAGTLAAGWGVVKSILVSQLLIGGLPLLILIRGGFDLRRSLGLFRPRAVVWIAAPLAMVSAWLVSLELAALMNMVMPFPEELLGKFDDFFAGINRLSPLAGLLLLAVLPAVCEEMLARGLLLRSFLPRFGVSGAVIFSAIAFGLLHLDLYRLLPTTLLGAVLGWIAVWSGSILPAMFAHALNNALIYILQRYPDEVALSWLGENSPEFLPWSILAAAVLLLVGSLLWLKKTGDGRAVSEASAEEI